MKVKLTEKEVKALATNRAMGKIWKRYLTPGIIGFVLLLLSLPFSGTLSVTLGAIGVITITGTYTLFFIRSSKHQKTELLKIKEEAEETKLDVIED